MFCDSSLTIIASVQRNEARLVSDLDSLDVTSKYVALAKNKPSQVTPENVTEILQVLPLLESPANSLYQAIHSVFAPVLLKCVHGNTSKTLTFTKLNLIAEIRDGVSIPNFSSL